MIRNPTCDLYRGCPGHLPGPFVQSRSVARGRRAAEGQGIAERGSAAGRVPTGTWVQVGDMALVRAGAAAALLADGRVLFTGGQGPAGPSASAELYNAWRRAGSSRPPRCKRRAADTPPWCWATAACWSWAARRRQDILSTAELYDSPKNTWVALSSMTEPRSGHTATLLADGRRVLIVGGEGPEGASATIEIFDPRTNAFVPRGSAVVAAQGPRGRPHGKRERLDRGRLRRDGQPFIDRRLQSVERRRSRLDRRFAPLAPERPPPPC